MALVNNTFTSNPSAAISPQDFSAILVGVFPIDDGEGWGKPGELTEVLSGGDFGTFYGTPTDWDDNKDKDILRANGWYGPNTADYYLGKGNSNLYIYNVLTTAHITAVTDELVEFCTLTSATTSYTSLGGLALSGVTSFLTNGRDIVWYFSTSYAATGGTTFTVYKSLDFAATSGVTEGSSSSAGTITLTELNTSGVTGSIEITAMITAAITGTSTSKVIISRTGTLANGFVVGDSVVISGGYTLSSNYTVDYGKGTVSIVTTAAGSVMPFKRHTITYNRYVATAVTAAQVATAIGTVKEEFMPKFKKAWNKIHAPGFSKQAAVVTALENAKTYNVMFYGSSLIELDDATITTSPITTADVIALKPTTDYSCTVFFNDNLNTASATLTDLSLADYAFSKYAELFSQNNGVPGLPMSNIDVDSNYTPKYENQFGFLRANAIANQGIATVNNNIVTGWVHWSDNRTASYAGSINVYWQDTETARDLRFAMANNITLRMLRSFIGKTRIEPSIIRAIVAAVNNYGKQLIGSSDLLGFEVVFNEASNSISNLENGIVTFEIRDLAPSATNQITFKWTTDLTFFNNLFG